MPPSGASENVVYMSKTHTGTQQGACQLGNKTTTYLLEPTEGQRTQPIQAPLQQIFKARTPTVRKTSPHVGFLEADPKRPAYLGLLLLLAGDIESNPGPTLCGMGYARRRWEATASDVLGANTEFINNVVVWTEPKLERCQSNGLMRSNAQSVGKQSDSAKHARPRNRGRHEENVGNRDGMTKEPEPTPRKLPQRISRSQQGTSRAFQ